MFLPDDHFNFGREPTLRRIPDKSLISFSYTRAPREPDPENVAAIIRSKDDGANGANRKSLCNIQSETHREQNFFLIHPVPSVCFSVMTRNHVQGYEHVHLFCRRQRKKLDVTGKHPRSSGKPCLPPMQETIRRHIDCTDLLDGFADDEKELLYLAIDCITEFFLVKVPYAELLQ